MPQEEFPQTSIDGAVAGKSSVAMQEKKRADSVSMICMWRCILVLLFSTGAAADELIRPDDQVLLPLPGGWLAGGDTAGFPIELVNEDLTAEFQVFRNELSKEDAIANGSQLQRAVDDIISDVIMDLPDAQLLTNTGFQEDNRVWFVLEFISGDSLTLPMVSHRLAGVLYGLPNDDQLLFTLWGKASADAPAGVQSDFRIMQDGFRYTGPSADYPFSRPNRLRWYLTGSLALVLVLIVALRRRAFRRSSHPVGQPPRRS